MNKLQSTQEVKDDTIMWFGTKHKGKAMVNIPGSYFMWLYKKGVKHKGLKKYIEDNLDAFKLEEANNSKFNTR